MDVPFDLVRPRAIRGISAVLLPFEDGGRVDWLGLEAHVTRTTACGLTPAVNMDTGYAHLIDDATKSEVLKRTAALTNGEFVAGAFDIAEAAAIRQCGGTPVLVPSERTARADVVATYTQLAAAVDQFIGFELSPVFNRYGVIWDLSTYREVLQLPQCVGAKHSSLEREPEWERLRLRDAERPGFNVFTGNDLAIDLVMYGSDYLLGLSTFAPDLFAKRDRYWASADARFFELNDALQHLGNVAFRPPVPAYRHSAALFMRMRGWIDSDLTPAGVPRRPEWEEDLLRECGERLELW
ncbi:MAG TPA: dihydrodipicolinate synthase family protein [Acidimicrobiales bacterium]|nr:dihydrodipicolinate synthase family protein [Acidimicrobiales bacterium]